MTKQSSHNFSDESSDCFPTLVAAGQHRQGLGDLVRLFFRLDFNNFKHFNHFYLGLQFRLDGFHASLKTTFVSILQLFADFSDASKEVSPTKFEKKNSGHHQPPRTSVSSPDPKQGTKLSGTSRLGSDVSASKPDPLTAGDPKQPENLNLNPRPAANFNLNEKVSNQISSLANRAKPGYLSHATKPFSVDDVKTFIDADSIIDYGSLATTQPIDVDEALGALDSLKFVKAEQKLPELSNQELRERVARKEKEVELWQTKNSLRPNGQVAAAKQQLPSVDLVAETGTKSSSAEAEKPICPTILPSLSSSNKKASSVDIFFVFSAKVDDASTVEVEIVKGGGSDANDTDDVISGFDGEWGSGWTSPLTAGTSSDGNLDDEDGFKTGNSLADSEEEMTWKAEDKRFRLVPNFGQNSATIKSRITFSRKLFPPPRIVRCRYT